MTNAEGGAAVAGHADGSFHVLWANDIGMTSVRAFDPEGEPLWPSREGITVSSGLQGQILADGAGGVWVAVNATPGGGFVQHFDREGWPLYRYWVYPPCGRVSGFVARASAASEPITYFSPEWF